MSDAAADTGPSRRALAALGLAVVALGAAVLHALAPVEQETFTYRFQPVSGVDQAAPNPAVAPLSIAPGVPDELEVVIPCEVTEPASGFGSLSLGLWRSADVEQRSAIVYPDLGKTLRVTVSGDVVSVLVRSREIFRSPIEAGPECAIRVAYADGTWTLDSGDVHEVVDNEGPRFAEASFEGPAAISPVSQVSVTTRELGSSPTPVQRLLLALGVAALGSAVWLMWRTGAAAPRQERRRWAGPEWAVAGGLALWAIFIPLNIDDGWIAARVGAYGQHGDIAGLFTAGSAPMPFGYWIEWFQHLWLSLGSSPLLMRVPAIAIGLVTWLGLRRLGDELGVWDGPRWVAWLAAGAFLTGFGAWGVTLRAEPILALLMLASVGCAVRFQATRTLRTLLWWSLVLVLAVTAHPAGVITLAPVLAIVPALIGWIRARRQHVVLAGALVGAVAAGALLVFYFDSSVATKAESIDAYRSAAHSLTILDEPDRYGFLDATPYATPMRRGAVALIFVALGAFGLNLVRRVGAHASRIPGWALGAAVLLLTVTPSKWPWHFGGLLALTALVLAIEIPRLATWGRWAAAVGTAGSMSWAWTNSLDWAVFDLRSYEWAVGAENLSPVSLAGLTFWVVAVAVVGGGSVWWARRRDAEVRPGALTIGLALALVLGVTSTTLVADTVVTSGWTFGGQNLASAVGRGGCGLGDRIEVPAPGSLRRLDSPGPLDSSPADAVAASLGFEGGTEVSPVGYPRTGINRTLPVGGMEVFGTYVALDDEGPDANTGSHRSGWRRVESETVVVMAMGLYEHWNSANAVAVQWGAIDGATIVDRGVVEATDLSGVFADWRLVRFEAPPDAEVVRTLLRDGTDGRGEAWVAAGAPLGITMVPVDDLAGSRTDILASPAIAPYFPCVEVPPIDAGVVPAPDVVLQTWRSFWQTTYAGAASSDRYFLVPIPTDLRSAKVGAHSGDVGHFVFVSQEHLTGFPARATGDFTRAAS